MTLKEAKSLKFNQTIYDGRILMATYKLPQRHRVNGKVKTWKTNKNRIQVPLKYGIYGHGYLDNSNIRELFINQDQALRYYNKTHGE